MRELLRTIERAVRARGWSARQASLEAVGSPHLITGMRRGRVPSVERVQALCEVLDLEFYIGPHREALEVEEQRLALALEATERGLSMGARRLAVAEKAQLVAAVYQLIGKERGPADAARVRRLIEMVARAGHPGGDGDERLKRMAKASKEEHARAGGGHDRED